MEKIEFIELLNILNEHAYSANALANHFMWNQNESDLILKTLQKAFLIQ